MILRRRTTRRVPSGAIAHPVELPAAVLGALDEQLGDDVAGELAGERQPLELPLHPAVERAGARTCAGIGQSSETSSRASHDLGGQGQLLDAEGAAQLRGGAGADDRGGHARAGRAPRPAPPRAASSRARRRPWRRASTTAAAARVEVAPRRSWRSARTPPRESDGVPVRYLPVSTPRPSGDQGRMPRPSAAAAGSTSCSMARLSREYSTCVEASGVRPGTARCQVAACAVCQPE